MFNLFFYLSTFGALSFLVLGLTAILRDVHSGLNRTFLTFSIVLGAWLVSNNVAGNIEVGESAALLANKLVLFFGALSVVSIFVFLKKLSRNQYGLLDRASILFALLVSFFSLTPYVVTGVEVQNDTYLIEFGDLSFVYFLIVLVVSSLSVYTVHAAGRTASGRLRQQLSTVKLSFGIGLSMIFLTNALLPFAFNFFGLTNVGSLSSVILVIGLAYAIVKNRLFDIKLIIARSLAYALLLSTLVLLYGAVVLLLATVVVQENESSRNVVSLSTAFVLSLTMPFFKRRFDAFTNRIFYRDSYDTQNLLDEFNQVIVSTIDLDQLLANAEGTMVKYLKVDNLSFAIRGNERDDLRVISNSQNAQSYSAIEKIRVGVHGDPRRIFVADTLEEGELKTLFEEAGIGLLARITSDSRVEGSGYVVLGYKQSGNIYNQQDIASIDIISNELAIAIQNAIQFEEIQKFNVTLQKKIDEATGQLKRSNEKLKALDEAKDEFVSMASHQLRTPLTSIKGYVSMVSEEDVGKLNKQQKKMLGQALYSSQRMVYLISDLLNVSRLKTGKFLIEQKPTYLPDVIMSEMDQIREGASAKNITLVFEPPKAFPTLNLDEMKTRQVIMNFIDNAIYYTPNDGKITMNLKDKKDSVEFSVKDTGIGVPKLEQHKLFTKFYRAENARKARPDGTGLGLFMAKKVIIAQGGSIVFSSTENRGSTFGFSFPKAKLEIEPEKKDKEEKGKK